MADDVGGLDRLGAAPPRAEDRTDDRYAGWPRGKARLLIFALLAILIA